MPPEHTITLDDLTDVKMSSIEELRGKRFIDNEQLQKLRCKCGGKIHWFGSFNDSHYGQCVKCFHEYTSRPASWELADDD